MYRISLKGGTGASFYRKYGSWYHAVPHSAYQAVSHAESAKTEVSKMTPQLETIEMRIVIGMKTND